MNALTPNAETRTATKRYEAPPRLQTPPPFGSELVRVVAVVRAVPVHLIQRQVHLRALAHEDRRGAVRSAASG